MAETGFRSDSAQTIKIYSELIFKQAMKKMFFDKFVGDGEDYMIQRVKDLETKQGDKITTTLVMELTGDGTVDDQMIEGNEEQMRTYDFGITTHLRGSGIVAAGKMSLKRTIFDKQRFRNTARGRLSNWLKNLVENDTVLALSGLKNPAVKNDDNTVVAAVPPSSLRVWKGGQTSGGSINRVASDSLISNTDNKHLFGTAVISTVKRMAQLADPIIRPVMTEDGRLFYVMFIHTWQAKALRADPVWLAAQKDANVRGEKNPIFTGALGVYEGVIVHEYERIITRKGTSGGTETTAYFESGDPLPNGGYAARALFCGAQAACHAWGQKPSWMEKDFDYGRKPGIATDIIFCVAKTKFNGQDFGCIAVDTAIVPDAAAD